MKLRNGLTQFFSLLSLKHTSSFHKTAQIRSQMLSHFNSSVECFPPPVLTLHIIHHFPTSSHPLPSQIQVVTLCYNIRARNFIICRTRRFCGCVPLSFRFGLEGGDISDDVCFCVGESWVVCTWSWDLASFGSEKPVGLDCWRDKSWWLVPGRVDLYRCWEFISTWSWHWCGFQCWCVFYI